jgi:hypothetical protein
MSNTLATTEAKARVPEILNPMFHNFSKNHDGTLNQLFKPGTAKKTNSWGVRNADMLDTNPSFEGGLEGGIFAEADSEEWNYRRVFYKNFSAGYRITRHTMRELSQALKKGDKVGARTIAAGSFGGTTASFKDVLNKLLHSENGEVATVSAVTSTGANGVLVFAGATDPWRTARIKARGRFVLVNSSDVARVNGGSAATKMKAARPVPVGHTCSFDTVPSDAAVGDKLKYYGTHGGRMFGTLAYHVNNDNNANYYGVDRGAYPQYKATVVDATAGGGSGNLSLALLDQLEDAQIHNLGTDGQDQTECIHLSNTQQRSQYRRLGDTKRTFNEVVKILDLSTQKVEHGRRWYVDKYADPTKIHRLRPEDFEMYEECPLQVADLGQADEMLPIMYFDSNGVGSYFNQQMVIFENNFDTFCRRPDLQAVLKNLNVDDGTNKTFLPRYLNGGN